MRGGHFLLLVCLLMFMVCMLLRWFLFVRCVGMVSLGERGRRVQGVATQHLLFEILLIRE